MKPFEEKFTAWVDGRLTGNELAAFEAELAQRENAGAEKSGALRLGALLRENYRLPELKNPDFFNHQLMQRIDAETAKPAVPERRASFFPSLPWMTWAGAFCIAMVLALYALVVPKNPVDNPSGNEYVAQILEAHTGDPAITATTIHSKDNKLTVLWLDGLDYLPADPGL